MHNPPVILIADDDVGFQEIVGTKLKRNGFFLAEAHDGTEAVAKAKTLSPDLILMDINMPGESGTEAVLDLMQNPETNKIKIIFLTNQTDPWPAVKAETKKIAQELGTTEFMNKTEDLDIIAEKVKAVLGLRA